MLLLSLHSYFLVLVTDKYVQIYDWSWSNSVSFNVEHSILGCWNFPPQENNENQMYQFQGQTFTLIKSLTLENVLKYHS